MAATQRAEPMREVDGHARRVLEHAALVVDAQAAPQHEGILEIRSGHHAAWHVGKSGQDTAA